MKKRNGILVRVGIVALVLTLVTGTMTSGTLARYTSTGTAGIKAVAAKWDASATVGESAVISGGRKQAVNEMIDLTTTMTPTTMNNLASGRIAPGTSGSFKILLDAGDSDVDISYKVHMFSRGAESELTTAGGTITPAPTNLTLTVSGAESFQTNKPIALNSDTFDSYINSTTPPTITSNSAVIAQGTLNCDPTTEEQEAGNDGDDEVTVTWDWPIGGSTANSADTEDGIAGGVEFNYGLVIVMEQMQPTA